MCVEVFEQGIEAGRGEGRPALRKDGPDQLAPPAFVVIRAGSLSRGTRPGGLKCPPEGRVQKIFVQFQSMGEGDGAVMPAHSLGQVNQRPGGIEENGADHPVASEAKIKERGKDVHGIRSHAHFYFVGEGGAGARLAPGRGRRPLNLDDQRFYGDSFKFRRPEGVGSHPTFFCPRAPIL